MVWFAAFFSILLSVFLKSSAAEKNEKEDESEFELSAAQLQFDMSNRSALIRALYDATRETKEQQTLAILTQALELIHDGTDLQDADSYGRTALLWAAMGASPATKPAILKVYAKIADRLIDAGVDVGRKDIYNNTAFDYLLYSSDYEMQTLLLENGAMSRGLGFDKNVADGYAHEAALTPGLMISIRLTTPVWSDRSRTGDPIEAVVTAPALRNSRVVLPPGTKLDGTVLFAQKAPSKYSQARLVLDIANVVQPDGTKSPVSTRVLVVDNARESVENNEIHGIIEPHASKKEGIAMVAVGIADPILGFSALIAKKAYGASLRREIFYPAGTDLTIQIVETSTLMQTTPWSGWPKLEADPELRRIVERAPLRTQAPDKQPSDLINVLLIGSQQELEAAFDAAGWKTADHLGLKSAFHELRAAATESGYDHAPLSLLTLNGRPPDIVFQKTLNTISKRHHVRIWKQPGVFYDGRPTWVAAATHDIGVGVAHKGTKWYHRIDPWVDHERNKVRNDLMFANAATGYALVERPSAPRKTSNATGDEIITDGNVLILSLSANCVRGQTPPSAKELSCAGV
jgi:hypothetical protein